MKHAEYVIIRGQVFRWEEKEPYVPSGKSYEGVLEYKPKEDLVRCHECGDWYRSIGTHIGKGVHEETPNAREYKIRHGLRLSSGISTPSVKAALARATPPASRRRVWLDEYNRDRVRLSENGRKKKAGLSKEFTNQKGVCSAQTISELQSLAAVLGRTPTHQDAPQKLLGAARRRFGSWNNALRAAGIELNREYRSRELLMEALVDFYALNRRLPKKREFGWGRLADEKTYRKHFGSVKQAFAASGLGLVDNFAAA